ncbi:hypothetical protein AB0J80_20980 [Actinoplanes sp. NPDC049548]|uniref:hypothetical protein n=1 Tax=Actinoplanes sp. NPDC049548 TaxID=3155152 RepID=UPI00343A68D4
MDADTVRPLHDRAQLLSVLTTLLDLVGGGTDYRLVGTGAALLQGVDLPTGDIDILLKQRADVDRFAAALSGFPCLDPPAWLAGAAQYFAHFVVAGVKVGFSTVEYRADTDVVECAGAGPWRHYVVVPCGQHAVPAVRLELRLVSELVRNCPDRWRPLTDHLRDHGAALDLVRRGMTDRAVPPPLQREVLNLLRPTR